MADTRECPSCAIEIDADADICPYCGYDLPKQRTSVKLVAILLILLMVLFILIT